MKPKLDVCLSNSLIHLNKLDEKLVVFIDVLRNTSVICTALYHGIVKVKPVAKIEEAKLYLGKDGHVVAGERNAIKLPEMDYGNSPYDYIDNKDIKGKTLVITSTNGTQSVALAKDAKKLVCGGFINEAVLTEYILEQNMPTVLLASGWKQQVNVEDTLCCGLLVDNLKDHFDIHGDPALIAHILYQNTKGDITDLIKKTSHYDRIASQNQKKDVEFCLRKNVSPVLPVYDGAFLRTVTEYER